MYSWNCCRTCLTEQSLYPIFAAPEHNKKYTNVIYTATGLKIELNDNLPQDMCSECINFINDSTKFHRRCEEAHKVLLSRLNNTQEYDIKLESHNFKVEIEISTSIDISHLTRDTDDEFKDYDDNITLDSFQCNDYITDRTVENVNINGDIIYENKIEDLIDKPVVFNNKQKKCTDGKIKAKRKLKPKKVTEKIEKKPGKKTANVREEIECEYCHKILTSKLSLRNHYKIHTGFDVVCEHCGKKFITRRLLLMHCRAKHGYEKTDKCSYCDYRASNAEQVKIHERLHTGEKPYVCAECKAGFHRKSSYLQHVAIHLPEKTVQCDQCPARFKSVTLMRIHKNRHRAPQYSFVCRVCDGSFARRRNVARHLQRVHQLQPDHHHIHRRKIA